MRRRKQRDEFAEWPDATGDALEPILSPDYWRNRLTGALLSGNLHHAVFRCSAECWQAIAEKHRQILAQHIRPTDRILDAACGWGRLLDLLPSSWQGGYHGVDLSPAFIEMARKKYGDGPFTFQVADLRDLGGMTWKPASGYDWAVLISVRPMMIRNLGEEVWRQMEAELRRVARKLLFLEYDPGDDGEIS